MFSIEVGRPVRGERSDFGIASGLAVCVVDGGDVCVVVPVGVGRAVSWERVGVGDALAAGRGTIAGWGDVVTRLGAEVETRGFGVRVGGRGVELGSTGDVISGVATEASLSVQLEISVARLPTDNRLVSRRLLRREGLFMRNGRSVLSDGRGACNRMRWVDPFVQCKRFYCANSVDIRVGFLRGSEYTTAGGGHFGRALMCRQPTQIVAKDFNTARTLVPCSV